MNRPLYVYDNWSTYDELSDAVPLTEELALFQLAQVRRLQAQGVKFDAYLMDAYWYDPDSGYRTWRADRWPNGPERWLQGCGEAGLKAGLWFPANTAFTLNPPESWRDSLASDGWGFCCFEGGFLAGFMEVLDHWYVKGVRVFKFDFAEFGAASDAVKLAMLPSEIRARNVEAYRSALAEFRLSHSEAILLGYNGLDEAEFMPWTDRPVRRVIDPAWLEVLDTVYCGDPRPADLPLANLWRTLDIYADHQIRFLNLGGLPLDRVDNCALMLGKTDTCYRRGDASWKTTSLLSYARRGNVHVTMGNLEAISDEGAQWIAQVQRLYEQAGAANWFGGLPGKGELYGYVAGTLRTLVNPGREPIQIAYEGPLAFSDGVASTSPNTLTLGPGGVAVTGIDLNLGASEPFSNVKPQSVAWQISGRSAEVMLPVESGDLHFGFTQVDAKGLAVRTSTGSGPGTVTLGNRLVLQAFDGETELPVQLTHDRAFWSGISWAYGVVNTNRSTTLRLRVESLDACVAEVRPFVAW